MKVYVSEEDKKQFKTYGNDTVYELKVVDNLTWSFNSNMVDLQSLEQHEQEIRKQERQKVIAELEEWIDKNKFDYDEEYYKDYDVKSWSQINVVDIKQKLNDMKGETK